ncbi:MAG TPA: ankyrin repeat domain-containing protein [Pyrinomonadaceae bacterium]|nr:ankyrin repeat domain-containing protein [Pyrinomonadaceae bacterium]
MTRNRILAFHTTFLFSIALVSVLHFTAHSIRQKLEPQLSRMLDLAAGRGEIRQMQLLIFLGADVNSKVYPQFICGNASKEDIATDYHFALQSAAGEGQNEAVELLLNVGADVNAADGFGRTAFWYAALGGHTDTVRLLTSRGAHVNPSKVDFELATPPLDVYGNEQERSLK